MKIQNALRKREVYSFYGDSDVANWLPSDDGHELVVKSYSDNKRTLIFAAEVEMERQKNCQDEENIEFAPYLKELTKPTIFKIYKHKKDGEIITSRSRLFASGGTKVVFNYFESMVELEEARNFNLRHILIEKDIPTENKIAEAIKKG